MIEVQLDSSGLCGFSRCRAPLPGSGPKGGRPFAYCPDRAWPGGKTCKQLAAAQDALVEALGEEDTPLTQATAGFTDAAEQLVGPLGEVAAMAEALKGALADEAKAAAERVEHADATAATERGLRESAEADTRRAQVAVEAAELEVVEAAAEVRRHLLARDQALADAKAAREAAKQSDLARARAEGIAATEHRRAEDALRQAAGEHTRAETARAEALGHQSRAETAQTDATMQHARAESADARAVEERRRADAAHIQAAEERHRADEATRALTEATATIATRTAELDAAHAAGQRIRDELARAAETNLDLAKELQLQQTANDQRLSDATTRLTTRLREALLNPAPEEDLRTRLLASLLDPS